MNKLFSIDANEHVEISLSVPNYLWLHSIIEGYINKETSVFYNDLDFSKPMHTLFYKDIRNKLINSYLDGIREAEQENSLYDGEGG